MGQKSDFGEICPKKVTDLVGSAREADIIMNGQACRALLIDTGSQVSTISKSFCDQLVLETQSLSNLINLSSASGHSLQYVGYVSAEFKVPDTDGSCLQGLFLVVPDTPFHLKVPALIGKNVLDILHKSVEDLDYRNEYLSSFGLEISYKMCYNSQ